MKSCAKYKIKFPIENIKYNNDKNKVNRIIKNEYILSDDEFNNLILINTDIKIYELLIKIYIYELKEKEKILELIQKSSKAFLYIIKNKIKLPNNLLLVLEGQQHNKFLSFQNILLDNVSEKKDISKIIDISPDLKIALEFIKINYKKIIQKSNSFDTYFRKDKIQFRFNEMKISYKILIYFDLIREIFEMEKNLDKKYQLLDYEELFTILFKAFSSKTLNEFYHLKKFIDLLGKNLHQEVIDNFYEYVHIKGIDLIKKNQMNPSEIILFISSKDIYYYSNDFKKSKKRDPEIMRYIPITDTDSNYMENIQLIKDYNILNIFIDSCHETEEKFYEILLEQIKNIKDFKNIFIIFATKNINRKFYYFITNKIQNLIYTIFDVDPENYVDIFQIFDILISSKHFYINDINDIIPDFYIQNKYFIYLLKNDSPCIKCFLSSGIFEANLEYLEMNNDTNYFIDMLLNSSDKYCQIILKNIYTLCFDEDDFYKKEINYKFIFYKDVKNKCKNLFKKYQNIEGTYIFKVNLIEKKILKDLENGNIKFIKLKCSMLEDKEFYNKIKLITSDEKYGEILYNTLKNNLEKCQKDLNNLETILDYYSIFYPKSKEEIINIIKEKKKEYPEDKLINELINIDIDNLINIKNFYLNEAIEESKNIKFKNSSFFMAIYKNYFSKDESKKSEDKILKESINNYNNILTEIIEKLESQLPLNEIKNIELIIQETLKSEFDWNKEINFIIEQFSFLNKANYIINNFKNDFIFFVEKFQFVKLIKGIIDFIEYNYKVNDNKDTKCFNNLKIIYNNIIENKINENNINEFIDLLKSNEYYINSDNIVIKFYKALLENKESLSFLKAIKESIFLNTKENKDLINIYIFFKKIFNNKEIITDKNFLDKYMTEIKNNKNLSNIINELTNKYYNFINNKEININNGINNLYQFEITFNYNNNLIKVQCNLNEKIKDIINKFIIKSQIDKNSIYFLYGGTTINEELLLSKVASSEDIKRNKMIILVNSLNDNQNNNINSIIKSKEIICPKCFKHINIKIKNYKIILSDCKNGHFFEDILFKNFQNSQNIDLKNIICNNCNQKNKHDTFNNEFFTCLNCNQNLCPICKSLHNKYHKIINYDNNDYVCSTHFESFNSYCKICKKNLCIKCEKEHTEHKKIYYGDILSNEDEIAMKIAYFGRDINKLNKDIDNIIEKLNGYKDNIKEFYDIYIDVMKNVQNKNRNYELLNNIIEMSDNDVIKDLKNIVNENNIKNKINLILDITEKSKILDNDEITLIYKVNKNDKTIKIFDAHFVENNKNVCKIIYNKKVLEVKEYIDIKNEKEKLIIKLKGINNITNASKMFYECKALESIPDIINFDLSRIIEMNEMFKGCYEGLIIPDRFFKN